jgi:soluble lytic murein transglycosylase-like protein
LRLFQLRHVFRKLVCAALLAGPAFGGEYVVFSSGSTIHVDRHEKAGEVIRLYTSNGFSEVPANSVTAFEADDYVPPPPAPDPVMPPLPPKPDTKRLVKDAAARYALPPKFVESVARVESAMKPQAVSPKGAIGVMQLMPSTAKALSADPNDNAQNIDAGTRLLRDLLVKYNGDVVKALAAYNAGEGAVDKYKGLPPYRETQDYVDKVIKAYQKSGSQ